MAVSALRLRLKALEARLDDLHGRLLTSSSLLSVSGDHDALGFHPSPEIFLGPGTLINKGLRVAGSPRQDHWIGEAIHANGRRSDQDTGEGGGQPCGDTFISPKYTCRIGLNTATSTDLNVHLEGDSDRVDDIKRAIMFYTNSPNRIKDIQARTAIQAGWSISVHGYTQNERLSRLALDRVVLKEIREKAELLENYIEKAPKYEGDVHRGVFFGSSKDAQSFIDDLQNSVSASVDSWSARRLVAEDFSGINEPKSWQRAAVVLTQKNKHGASIKRYSAIPEEDEVLQPSGLRYRVISITERVEGSLARPLTIYEVEVEAVEHRSMQRKTVLDSFFARLDALEERFDARRGPGGGKPCGAGWIDPRKTCRKGAAAGQPGAGPNRFMQLHQETQARKARKAAERQAQAAATAAAFGKGEITIDADGGEPRFRGLQPTRSLGGGAFGKTYQFDTPDGPVVVKVNSLRMGDPAENDPRVGLAEQRENVARRELRNLQRAHAAGLGPEPIGDVVQLPDGRWSLAYRMQPGSKLTPSHQTVDLTPEAAATLSDPKAAAYYVAGALQLARRQADSGLIHGDLHGANILVGPDGTPSLIDWAMTREAPNPWNLSERSPAMRAIDEGYALRPLVEMSGQRSVAEEQGKILSSYSRRAESAEKAYKAVIDSYDLEWEEANEDQVGVKFEPDEWRRRMVEANRIKREEGLPYDMALRDPRVGLEPPLTPDVLARAAAARDAIFGQSDLDDMRRELDRRFGGQA